MALDIDAQRKACNMARHQNDIDAKGCYPAAKALGADPCLDDLFQELFFLLNKIRDRVCSPKGAEQ